MANFTCSANVLKYASGSSWTSGKARQGVYSGTRYEGAISFSELANLQTGNIDITQIQLRVQFNEAGRSSTKYLTFYKATSNTISGSIASMRGASIGALSISNAYNRTVTITFEVIESDFEEFERVRIPSKGITGYIVDIYNDDDGKTYYLVENEEWGDVDDPDAWNIGYAHFDCTADQLAKIDEEAG